MGICWGWAGEIGVDCGIFRVIRWGVDNMGVWEGRFGEEWGECVYLCIEEGLRLWDLSEGGVEGKRGIFGIIWSFR